MTRHSIGLWFRSAARLLFPRRCVVCGARLVEGEEGICLRCNMDMPRTNWHLLPDNPVEKEFWGKIPLERATSFFLYHKGSDFRHVLHLLKYGGRKDIGRIMGRFMAQELQDSASSRASTALSPSRCTRSSARSAAITRVNAWPGGCRR